MKRCILCGRKIQDKKHNFGLGCLKRVCSSINIKRVKNLKAEEILNSKISNLCRKRGLPIFQKQLLTDRYLTLNLLNEVPFQEYDKYKTKVKEDISKIDRNTKLKELESFDIITLKQANEINKKYKDNKEFFNKMINGDYDALQNISFDIIRFAFKKYYSNKTYYTDITLKTQKFIFEVGAFLLKASGYTLSAQCLKHALKLKPKDIVIEKGFVIKKIKEDVEFKKKIRELIEKYEIDGKISVDNNKEIIRFSYGDLLLSLHDATIRIKGKKDKNKNWNLEVEINDKYDFTDFKELKEYADKEENLESRVGALANNFAMIGTSSNVLHEYNVIIKINLENWEV